MKTLLRRLRAVLRPVPKITDAAPARRHRPATLVSSFAPAEHRAAVAEIEARGAQLAAPLDGWSDDPIAYELADGDLKSPLRAQVRVYSPSSQAGTQTLIAGAMLVEGVVVRDPSALVLVDGAVA